MRGCVRTYKVIQGFRDNKLLLGLIADMELKLLKELGCSN